jgi:hypothetical protein
VLHLFHFQIVFVTLYQQPRICKDNMMICKLLVMFYIVETLIDCLCAISLR